ncbi:MAG: 16S rRNA methyltransferase, partial [Caldiserica bacterium]
KIAVFVGPEGGFSKNEIDFAIKNDIKIFLLGKRVLRMEVAVAVIVGVISIFG